MRLALAGVLAATLLAPGAARAATVIPGDYTGGGLGDEPALAFLSIADDQETLRGVVTVRADCEAYGLPVEARIAIPDTQLTADGVADGVRRITGTARGPDGQQANEDGEATFTVRVGEDGYAEGTARLRSTFRDARTGAVVAECDTGEQGFRAAVVPETVPRRTARAPRSGDYIGGVGLQPLVARVRGGDLTSMTVLYRSGCQRRATGSAVSRIVAVPRLDLAARVLAFRARGFNRLFTADGEELVRFELSGRFRREGSLSGTIRYRGVMRDNDGRVVARCDSGVLRWRAIRPRD